MKWPPAKLAERAGVQVATVMRAERTWDERMVTLGNLQTIQNALEAAGVEFTNCGEPDVRRRR
ncbi:MAG: hypothetical protein Q8M07_10325 [Prosthecobacter sp.]|nr:hypothetical protein [Prosthecobacter sp.]